MKVLVTGAAGFVGRNLSVMLGRQNNVEITGYDLGDPRSVFDEGLKTSDVVFHLAGVNRPEKPEDYAAGNAGFTREICDTLRDLDRKPLIILSSSIQATLENPNRILQPGMFASTTVELPSKPAVITVPETAVDYTLYGDSVWLITGTKDAEGKESLKTDRTFVKTGQRINGRVVIVSGVKPGDRVVAVGQLKLQSGSAVTISSDQPPPIPAQAPRY